MTQPNDWRIYVSLGRMVSLFKEIHGRAASKKSRREVLKMLSSIGWEGEAPSMETPRRELEETVVSIIMGEYNKIMDRYCKTSAMDLTKIIMTEQEAFLKRCGIAGTKLDNDLLPISCPIRDIVGENPSRTQIISDYVGNRHKMSSEARRSILRLDNRSDSDIDDDVAIYRAMHASLREVMSDIGIVELEPEWFAVCLWCNKDIQAKAIKMAQLSDDTGKFKIEINIPNPEPIPVDEAPNEAPAVDVEEPVEIPAEPKETKSICDILSKYTTMTELDKDIVEYGILGAMIKQLEVEDDVLIEEAS